MPAPNRSPTSYIGNIFWSHNRYIQSKTTHHHQPMCQPISRENNPKQHSPYWKTLFTHLLFISPGIVVQLIQNNTIDVDVDPVRAPAWMYNYNNMSHPRDFICHSIVILQRYLWPSLGSIHQISVFTLNTKSLYFLAKTNPKSRNAISLGLAWNLYICTCYIYDMMKQFMTPVLDGWAPFIIPFHSETSIYVVFYMLYQHIKCKFIAFIKSFYVRKLASSLGGLPFFSFSITLFIVEPFFK